ncbi:hypothetical protein CRUP_003094, partial [Coryphaenoides rupestris]
MLIRVSVQPSTPSRPQVPGQQGELWRLQQLLSTTEPLSSGPADRLSILMSRLPRRRWPACSRSASARASATVPDGHAPVQSPEQFKALGLSSPAGVLLAGPPGCGKTLLAKYVGESERAVRQVFQRGSNSAPCVIFFDEIDALCPRRSGHESGASMRVVNQLLTEMDGLETRKQVFIMAATNRPDIIDPAMLRPGRLDKTLYVSLPPPSDRHAILLTITKGGTRPALETDVNLEEIALDERCDCFTERAVRQVFQRGSNSAPCVIFFDEIDALCPRRSGHESGASMRVVNQLLTEMDGLETRKQVFIMAATNRPDIIDPAMLRPGRLDKTLYVSLPPPSDRHAILLTITKGGTRPALETDVNLEEIALDERCDCFTGPVAHIRVSRQNFEDAFKKVRPSVSKK